MRLFIDSANLNEIREAMDSGIVSGVTTNQSIIAKEPKGDFIGHIKKIIDILSKYSGTLPLSIEVFERTPSKMIDQAIEFVHKFGYLGINIKVPVTWENLQVIDILSNNQINVNATCIFTDMQAAAALKAGAKYVSLFYNRAKDYHGIHILSVLKNITAMCLQENVSSINCRESICGSIRSAQDIWECFGSGAHIVTAGLSHIKDFCNHEGTDAAIKQFNEDFANWMGDDK